MEMLVIQNGSILPETDHTSFYSNLLELSTVHIFSRARKLFETTVRQKVALEALTLT